MNRATRTNVATLGTIFGISGMSHGFFEILQGSVPTDGLFISAIGEAQKMWPHGDEPAFTLIPNFLLTGIAAMIVGLAKTRSIYAESLRLGWRFLLVFLLHRCNIVRLVLTRAIRLSLIIKTGLCAKRTMVILFSLVIGWGMAHCDGNHLHWD